MLEMLNIVMQWLVAPIIAAVWMLYNKANKNETDIAVLKAMYDSSAVHHDREMKEMRDTIKAIFNKLDSIEHSLRGR
jgi:hypothetical protein